MTIPFNNVTTSEKNQCSELVNYSIFRNIFVLSGNKSDESNQQIMLKTLFRYMLVYFKLSSHNKYLTILKNLTYHQIYTVEKSGRMFSNEIPNFPFSNTINSFSTNFTWPKLHFYPLESRTKGVRHLSRLVVQERK